MLIWDFHCPKCYEVMESAYENAEESKIIATCRHHRKPMVFHFERRPRSEESLREILATVGAEDLLD